MSAAIKIQLSRLALIACATALVFASLSTAAIAQSMGQMKETAEVVAGMNVMQLMAYIMLASIGSNVVIVGFLVRAIMVGQKEVSAKMAEIVTGLHNVSENCARKVCPR